MSDNPVIRKLFHLAFLLKRPMTLGVRVIATNEVGEILLVKHTYTKGWYMPGGGVETGETCPQAAVKELQEETGFEPVGELKLLGIYLQTIASKRDHVLVYRCDAMQKIREFAPNREIAEMRFFAMDALPDDLTKGCRQRIDEHFHGAAISQYW